MPIRKESMMNTPRVNIPQPNYLGYLDATGRAIRQLREAKGLSQNVLARQTNMTQSSISLIESGQRAVSLETLINIAYALDTAPSKILREAELLT
jgi:transcriptional regulator with XRE-family HTH domain